jgi:hypothetical protein
MKGSKPGLTSIAVINLIHCREWAVIQEPNDETLEPLYAIDINKVNRKEDKENQIENFVLVKKTSNGK